MSRTPAPFKDHIDNHFFDTGSTGFIGIVQLEHSVTVPAPKPEALGRIQECPVQIEARIINSMFIGNCGKELVSIETNILNTHVADNLLCRIKNI